MAMPFRNDRAFSQQVLKAVDTSHWQLFKERQSSCNLNLEVIPNARNKSTGYQYGAVKMLDTRALLWYGRVFWKSSQVRSSRAHRYLKKKEEKRKSNLVILTSKCIPGWAAEEAGLGQRPDRGSGVARPSRFFSSSGSSGQPRPGRPGRSRLPRGSAPHSCPALYLTSGPRPAAAAPRRAPY